MYSYCPHCGQTLEQEQAVGQRMICRHCGQDIGVVKAAPAQVLVDGTEESIRQGIAARCPVCRQAVEVRGKSFAAHYADAAPRKICPGSGKPSAATAPAAPEPAPTKKPPPGKDLSAYMTKDLIKVVLLKKDGRASIEELTLEYLDKADRVRLQIDALRDILGADFRLRDDPFDRTHLSVWGNAGACVVAKKHSQGGYQPMTDAEIKEVLALLPQAKSRLFP